VQEIVACGKRSPPAPASASGRPTFPSPGARPTPRWSARTVSGCYP